MSLFARLFVLLLIFKTYIFWGKGLSFTPLTPIALFWQDLVFLLLASALPFQRDHRWLSIPLAVLFCGHLLSLKILGSPLNSKLWEGADIALADSIVAKFTFENITFLVLYWLLFIKLPRLNWLTKIPVSYRLLTVFVVFPLGIWSSQRTDTQALHQNPFVAPLHRWVLNMKSDQDSLNREKLPSQLQQWKAAAKNMNIILVGLESTSSLYLKTFGGTKNPMPYLDQLAKNSLVFEEAYAAYPGSIKGFDSVVCSRYPAIGIKTIHLAGHCHSFVETLQQAGFRTQLIHSGRFYYLGMRHVIEKRGYDKLIDAGDIEAPKTSFGIESEFDAIERIFRAIDESQDKPFFIHYLPIAGHHPYSSPEPHPFGTQSEKQNYLNSLYHADLSVKKLVEGLEARSLYENTLLVFYGDHGQAFGQHPGNFAHSLFLYEENLKVPVMFHSPRLIKETIRSKSLFSLVDLAPTLMEFVGLKNAGSYQGLSQLSHHSDSVFFLTDHTSHLVGARRKNRKSLLNLDTGLMEQFDLDKDPGEQKPFREEPEMSSRLRAWSAQQRERYRK